MLERLLEKVSPFQSASHWYVAYSGGIDSTALLFALYQLKQSNPSLPEITAIHINHKIQSEADDWQAHCQQFAESLQIPFVNHSVELDEAENIELAARKARYQAFDQVVGDNAVLFQGHHANDQLETFLFRLFRGAGVKGLTAIPEERKFIKRKNR